MLHDWLSSLRNARQITDPVPEPAASEAAAVESLAAGIQQLCVLCDNLLDLVACAETTPAAQPLLRLLPEQIAAVRACAGEIQSRQAVRSAALADPYSLAALAEWTWRE